MPTSPVKDKDMGQKPCSPVPPVRTDKGLTAGKDASARKSQTVKGK